MTKTNAELQLDLRKANTLIEKQKGEIAIKNEQIADLRAKGAGYLVIADNPMYDGMTIGVQFARGFAFIPSTRVFDIAKPLKETQLSKYPAAERKKIRQREKRPSVEIVVEQFRTDFAGYKIIEFDGSPEDDQRMAELVDQQVKDFAVANEFAQKARQELENLSYPQRVDAVVGT